MPDGTPVREYPRAADAERVVRLIEAERDLVVGAGSGGEVAFYRSDDFAVGDDGRIWVVDGVGRRVVVFDPDGEPAFTLGRPGQGPGEFRDPYGIAMIGDRVAVFDSGNRRVSVWGRDGSHVADHAFGERRLAPGIPSGRDATMIVGASADTLLAVSQPPLPIGRPVPPTAIWDVSRLSLDATELDRYIELRPGAVIAASQGGGRRLWSVPLPGPRPLAALAAAGRAYVTPGDEYQVLAIGPMAERVWALRIAWTPATATGEEIEAVLAAMNADGREPPIRRQEVNWPARHPAIDALAVDGRGNLYVFPYRFTPPGASTPAAANRPVAVDVYSPEGDRLFTGQMLLAGWHAALGDHVYRFETDESGDQVVARYRLTTPF